MVNDILVMDQIKNKSFESNKDTSFSSIESDSINSDKKIKLNTPSSKSKMTKEEREEEKRKKQEEKAKELEDKKKIKEERERLAEEKKKIKEERKKLWEEKKKEKEKEIEEKRKQLEEMKKSIEQKKAEKEALIEAKKKEKEEKKKFEEEEKIKKENARLKKEEEKSKKQEERKRMEDEKLKKQKLISNKFVHFFQKIDPSNKPVNGLFELKNKSIANYIPKVSKENFVLGAFDSIICHQDEKVLYLDELKNKTKTPHMFRKKQINDIEQFNDGIVLQNLNNEKKVYKAKLLQFQENNRPAYFGTWRKKSNLIKGKKPFEKDIDYFDYSIDSDDEWEEEERGESIKDSDSEQSGNEENDYELDDFFVPHGHLSDDENQDDELVDIQEMPNGQKKRKLLTKEKLLIEERTKKLKRLMPKAIGCLWMENDDFCNKAKFMSFDKFKVVFIN